MRRWVYLEFWWALHNLVAHPLSQFAWWLSLCGCWPWMAELGNRLHDWTVPRHTRGEGRG